MKLFGALVIALCFGCAREAPSQESSPVQRKPPTISLSIHADHDTVKVGTPIVLKATLTNRSDHEITFGHDRNRGIFDVDVLDETGKFAPDKRPGYRNGRVDLEQLARTWSPEQLAKSGLLTGSLVYTVVKPGGILVEVIEVSKYYDMTEPGVYKIVIQRPDLETTGVVKSNSIELTVTK